LNQFPTEKLKRKTPKKKLSISGTTGPASLQPLLQHATSSNSIMQNEKYSKVSDSLDVVSTSSDQRADSFLDLLQITDFTDDDGNFNFLDFSVHEYS
jgi:hypothetical protein